MAGSINKVILVGNVGQEPEIRATSDGREIANISLATSESWKDKNSGEKKEKTEWHKVVIFNEGLVNVVKNYIKKGSKLYVEGALQTRKWQDQQGNDRYSTEVVLKAYNGQIVMLGGKGDSTTPTGDPYGSLTAQAKKAVGTQQPAQVEELDDEIPF